MAAIKGTGGTSGTSGVGATRDLGGMVAMYGVIMRDDLGNIRRGVMDIKKKIEGALGRSELMGTDEKDAKEALTQITKALKDLEVPGGKMARKAKDTPAPRRPSPGGMVAMYGVIIRNELSQFRSSIQNLMGRLDRAIANGSFESKADLQDAKQVRRRLENAMTMLNVRG